MASRIMSLLPGFEMVRRIGRGAGASLILAREVATGNYVTVKHVIRRGPDDDKFIAQAENEYEVSHKLEHPYLRRTLDIVRIRKWLKTQHLFLIMEFVDGEKLEDRFPSDLKDAIGLFKQIAEGLGAMHETGYVHADIKPNNILLCNSGGGIKIIDFGQSCPIDYVKTRIQGTPDFIAPEQAMRKKIDQRTDVFNLGATMYRCVTGKLFQTVIQNVQTGDKRIAVEDKRASDPPHVLDPEVPIALSRLIMECCETSPDNRPKSMRNVISRLETIEHVIVRREAEGDPGSNPAEKAVTVDDVFEDDQQDDDWFDEEWFLESE